MHWHIWRVTRKQADGDPPSRHRRPTLADVAREAGVSVTTASLVMRLPHPPNVGQATQERVRETAKQLGYIRNQAATELRNQLNSTIGFIADGIAQGPFAGEMIRGAQDAAWQQGYLLMIVETGHDGQLVCEAVTRFTERRVRRIIYAQFSHQEAVLPSELANVNPILANGFDAKKQFASVVPDEFGGGFLATRTLLKIRRTPVGFINLSRGDPAGAGRLRGYRAALEEVGVPFDDSLVVYAPKHPKGHGIMEEKYGENAVDGYKAAQVLFRRHPDLNLLFCGTDRMAMGAYDYLKETGKRIPQDISIVGFDNQLLIASQVRPALTTIALPHFEMGKTAVQLALKNSDGQAPEQIVLPCRLVTRKST
jgi:LacI family transcriptional regulator